MDRFVAIAIAALVAGCGPRTTVEHESGPSPGAIASGGEGRELEQVGLAGSAERRDASAPAAEGRVEAAPGVVVERLRGPEPEAGVGDGLVTLVRIDSARYRPVLLTAKSRGGRPRPLPEWVREGGLAAAVNAGMYHADGSNVGLLVRDGVVENGRDNPLFGGFLAFEPRRPGRRDVAGFGRGCPGFDLGEVRRGYRSVVQSYRLLDCAGGPIAWADEKLYSAAALGLDRDGRLVMVHSRTPYRMRTLSRFLAAPAQRLRSLLFVEGGPEASLVVEAGALSVREVGSFETGFVDNDDNHEFWPLPNVLGVVPRGSTE